MSSSAFLPSVLVDAQFRSVGKTTSASSSNRRNPPLFSTPKSRTVACIHSPPSKAISITGEFVVDRKTGLPPRESSDAVSITEGLVQLPSGVVDGLSTGSGPVSTNRPADALAFLETRLLPQIGSLPVVIFAHGFSQRPINTKSLLVTVAALGYLVLAPRTWVFDVIRTRVQGIPWFKLPAKLQTAVLIDTMRVVSCAKALSADPRAASYILMGHSMGGAQALLAAQYLQTDAALKSVLCLSPAVDTTVATSLNPLLHGDKDSEKQEQNLLRFFSNFTAVPVQILHGNNDRIVPTEEIIGVVGAMRKSRQAGAVTVVSRIISGTHIGFEDDIDVDVPGITYLDKFVFGLLDLLIFGGFLDLFQTKQQLAVTKQIVRAWYPQVLLDPSVENLTNTIADLKASLAAENPSAIDLVKFEFDD